MWKYPPEVCGQSRRGCLLFAPHKRGCRRRKHWAGTRPLPQWRTGQNDPMHSVRSSESICRGTWDRWRSRLFSTLWPMLCNFFCPNRTRKHSAIDRPRRASDHGKTPPHRHRPGSTLLARRRRDKFVLPTSRCGT